MRNLWKRCGLAAFGLMMMMMAAAPALAEELEGTVLTVGNALNTEVMLTQPKENKGPNLCYTDLVKRVKKLAAMSVKVTGDWKVNAKGEKTCFDATDFTVTKTSSGRDAVVGVLSDKDGVYQVTGDDGKVMLLSDVSGGLKKLSGQKVILDLKAMDSPASKEATFKVVTYAAFP